MVLLYMESCKEEAMSDATLGVLVHGAGWVAGEHIRAFTANPHTRVVAISSRKLSSCQRKAEECGLENVACYTDLDKALDHEGVDIVSGRAVLDGAEVVEGGAEAEIFCQEILDAEACGIAEQGALVGQGVALDEVGA